MADGQIDTAQGGETNGVAVPAPVQTERAKMTRAEQDAADRAAFLAGDESEVEAPAPVKAKAKKPEPVEAESEDAEEVEALADAVEEEDDDLDLEDDEDVDAQLEDDEDEVSTKGKEDPELAKRLAQVRKHEKRVREQAAARDRAFEQERNAFVAEWKPKIEAAEKLEQLKARRSDVIGTLKAIGYTEDDFEWIAPIVHGSSKAGAADPKYRDYAKKLAADRELKEESAAARREAAEVREMLAKRDAQAAADREVDVYRERIAKSAGDLTKKRMGLAPKATRLALDRLAHEMATKTGALVDPKRVAATYEKRLRATIDRAKQLAADDAAGETTAAPKVKAKPKAQPIEVIDKTKAIAASKSNTLIPSREEMIERMRKIDRGELDPDAD